jgi:hypothetical protein
MDSRIERYNFVSEKQFELYWKNILFPELASRKNRPPVYNENDAEWVWASDVRWNVNYTRQLFPEELWELRNSGALLRDWEESISWIYFEYAKDFIFKYFNGLEFTRIK